MFGEADFGCEATFVAVGAGAPFAGCGSQQWSRATSRTTKHFVFGGIPGVDARVAELVPSDVGLIFGGRGLQRV